MCTHTCFFQNFITCPTVYICCQVTMHRAPPDARSSQRLFVVRLHALTRRLVLVMVKSRLSDHCDWIHAGKTHGHATLDLRRQQPPSPLQNRPSNPCECRRQTGPQVETVSATRIPSMSQFLVAFRQFHMMLRSTRTYSPRGFPWTDMKSWYLSSYISRLSRG